MLAQAISTKLAWRGPYNDDEAYQKYKVLCYASSLIQAVDQEELSNRKPDRWPLWMAGHAQLKFVMTECSKTQIRLTGLI